jgi:hypothetical protein
MITKIDAIQSLRPNSQFVIHDGVLEWHDTNQTKPTDAEINAEVTRLQAEYDAKAYQRSRQPEYPAIGDQLDDLYKAGAFSDDMTAKIKAVKDKYPKG